MMVQLAVNEPVSSNDAITTVTLLDDCTASHQVVLSFRITCMSEFFGIKPGRIGYGNSLAGPPSCLSSQANCTGMEEESTQ